jgi:GTPase SAR1 family protein
MYKQDPEQVTVKFIVLGNQGVGKTSFLSHACPDSFKPDLSHKIGIDFMTTYFLLPHTEDSF